MGINNTSSGNYSASIGLGNTSNGSYTFSANAYNTAHDFCETVHGRYNVVSTGSQTSWTSTDSLFVIGNGTGTSARSNALQVLKNANVGINNSSFNSTAVGVLSIKNGTAPSAHIDDHIQIYSVDSSDSTATLGLELEQAVEDIGTFTASHKIKVKINGTEYWLQLDAV